MKILFKLIIVCSISVLLTSCYSTNYFAVNGFKLKQVQELTSENDLTAYIKSDSLFTYSDSIISVQLIPTDKNIGFIIENKTNSVLSLDWNNAMYFDFDGTSKKTMHAGVKFIDKNTSQPPTTILPKSKIEDQLLPTENVYWSSKTTSWEQNDLFPSISNSKEGAGMKTSQYVGKDIKIMLPIIYKNSTLNYLFTLNIDKAVVVENRYRNSYTTSLLIGFGLTGAVLLLIPN